MSAIEIIYANIKQDESDIPKIPRMYIWYQPNDHSSKLEEGLTYVVRGKNGGNEDVGNNISVEELAQKVIDFRRKGYNILIGQQLGEVKSPLPSELNSSLLKLIGVN
jgi:hypothetical protein